MQQNSLRYSRTITLTLSLVEALFREIMYKLYIEGLLVGESYNTSASDLPTQPDRSIPGIVIDGIETIPSAEGKSYRIAHSPWEKLRIEP